jgi:mono/diheme cytochrome c family protein
MLGVLTICLAIGAPLEVPGSDRDDVEVDFARYVRPILAGRCVSCHGPDVREGGLRLDVREAALAELDSGGHAIVPGNPQQSLLLARVASDDQDERMPPEGEALTDEQIHLLRQWIAQGAKWPRHWAFEPLGRPAVPSVDDPGWVRNPIDAFIWHRLKEAGLSPSPPADKVALVRRASYDLTGLPPTPEEVDAFVGDDSPVAYERLVERLLASPRYGEKWARHWLDLVRFAETNSFERDNPKPHAWRYRDYVISALNDDKPWDQFVREQLAGDELPEPSADSIIATGFYRLGLWDDEPSDRIQAKYDELDDIVKTTAQVFLGLTVDCARCHEHKIDPIPQADYYRMLAFFHNISPMQTRGENIETRIFPTPESREQFRRRFEEHGQRVDQLQGEIAALEAAFRSVYQPRAQDERQLAEIIKERGKELLGPARFEKYGQLTETLKKLQATPVESDWALCVSEHGRTAPDTYVLARGNAHVRGEKVVPGFLSVLGLPIPDVPSAPDGINTSGRRSVLANWIVSPDNPLAARVIVNRIWQHHFVRGIVRSPNDFGLHGTAPTHPELLDWLACEFIERGWHMKEIHRLIMTSNTYRMASRANPRGMVTDPNNDLFWRFDMRRLTAEEIRDSMLMLAGTLNLRMYGPSIYPSIPKDVLQGQSQPGYGWTTSSADEQARRSIYIHIKRSLLPPILETFDFADTDSSCPVRFATTQPTQALAMLNGEFIQEQAALFAERLRHQASDGPESQATRALRLAVSRPPSPLEIRRALDLMTDFQQKDGVNPQRALDYFCLTVFNLNEFVYLD